MLPKTKTISNNKTISLINQYKGSGDIEVRNEIVMGNLGLVYLISHKYRGAGGHQAFDDFVSEGTIGLIEAIDRFDTSRKNNFSTYAYWRVLKRINNSISIGTLGIPEHRINILRSYEKIKNKMLNLGEDPNIETIAKAMNVSEKILIDTINQKDDISFDGPGLSMNGMRSCNGIEDQIINAIDFERAKSIIMDVLSEKEKMILWHRFGLDDAEELTLTDISKKLNVSTECVRIIQNKSLRKIGSATRRKALLKK